MPSEETSEHLPAIRDPKVVSESGAFRSWQSYRNELGAPEFKLRIETLKRELAAGHSEMVICEMLGWKRWEVRLLIQGMVIYEKKAGGMLPPSAEETYLRFALRAEDSIGKLDRLTEDMIAKAKTSTDETRRNYEQHTIAAIKLKMDLVEKILETGQSLGVVNEAAKKIEVGKKNLSAMDQNELAKMLKQERKNLENMLKGVSPGEAIEVKSTPVEPTEDPTFSPGTGRPVWAKGGRAKSAGANAVRKAKRSKAT